MARVVFYEPEGTNANLYSGFRGPRLGILILGAMLKRAGHDVSVYADNVLSPTVKELSRADVVGISTITPTAPRAYEVADILRQQGLKVVLGGPHPTFLPEEALGHADYVFRGEAENSILDMVTAIMTGDRLESVKGLSFKRNGNTIHNEPAVPVSNLDSVPAPDFSLLKGESPTMEAMAVLPVMTSRGCPFGCSFCNVTKMFGRKYRFRSAEQVIQELATLDLRRRVFFYDDNLAASRPRLHELLEGILGRGLRFSWSAQVRADVAEDEELVELMRRSGCRTLNIGMESVEPNTLKTYNKSQDVSDIVHSIRVLHKYGIRVRGMFVVGADTDTPQTVATTLRFALDNKIDSMQILMLTPLPGTDWHREAEEQSRIRHRDWSLYDGHHVIVEPSQIGGQELRDQVVEAIRRFYSIPRILWDGARLRFLEARMKMLNRSQMLGAYGGG